MKGSIQAVVLWNWDTDAVLLTPPLVERYRSIQRDNR